MACELSNKHKVVYACSFVFVVCLWLLTSTSVNVIMTNGSNPAEIAEDRLSGGTHGDSPKQLWGLWDSPNDNPNVNTEPAGLAIDDLNTDQQFPEGTEHTDTPKENLSEGADETETIKEDNTAATEPEDTAQENIVVDTEHAETSQENIAEYKNPAGLIEVDITKYTEPAETSQEDIAVDTEPVEKTQDDITELQDLKIRLAAKEMSNSSGFVFVMFLNDGNFNLTKSWICNVEIASPDILKYTLFVTPTDTLSKALLDWRRGLVTHVHADPNSETKPQFPETIEHFQMRLARLRVQNSLIQNGTDIVVVDAYGTWFSGEIVKILRAKLKTHDIISPDDKEGWLHPDFMGIRSNAKSRMLFTTLLNQHILGDTSPGGERDLTHLLFKQLGLNVYWLNNCEYAYGKMYHGFETNCTVPMIKHNSANDFGRRFVDQAGECRSNI